MLLASNAPRHLYGFCFKYAGFLLNNLPYAAGEKLTCREKALGRLIPGVRARFHAFGCAAFKHMSHPTGPATDKLDPKAEEHIFIGVNEKANDYYLASLPHFKISNSAHVIFVEDDFPCKRVM